MGSAKQGADGPKKQNAIAKANLNASRIIGKIVEDTLTGAQREVSVRAYRASNELRNASLYVLRGKRSGRMYTVPNTGRKYRASKAGEAPAVRTGAFRLSWGTHVHVEKAGSRYRAVSSIESRAMAGGKPLGDLLEKGSGRMRPRPYKRKVVEKALPKIKELYNKPYRF